MPENLSDLPHLTDEERKWAGLCEGATPGEWERFDTNHIKAKSGFICWRDYLGKQTDHDLDFIAAARTALPALLREVSRLREENKADFETAVDAVASVWRKHSQKIEAERDALRQQIETLRAAMRNAMEAAVEEDIYRYRGTDDRRAFYIILRDALKENDHA